MTLDFTTPEWVKDAIFYQIFPDRFARSKRVPKSSNLEPWGSPPTLYGFKGGDLLGVVEHLDYLEDLGINALYFNPILQSAANHRYHTHDYYRVDPLLGGETAFYTLLEEAHRRNIRIILDGVFNHASRGFFQFHHILENQAASPYLSWFIVKDFPLNAYQGTPNYQCWYNLPALPEFNTDNPEVRAFILNVARYWLDQGIDGWRLDVPFCIDDDRFWQEFRRVVKEANREAYIVGEIATDATHWLQGDQFDAVMNYLFTSACLGFFAGEGLNREILSAPVHEVSLLDAPAFARRVEELLAMYPREAVLAQLNLLDSHDTPRFLTLARGDEATLRLAILFQMTYPGAPCIYYGDEIGMEGGPDPDCRRAFPWDESRWNSGLRDFVKQCIALRRAHPALRRGEYTSLHAEAGVYAYLRCLDDDLLVVVLNNDTTTYHLDIPMGDHLADGTCLHNLVGSGEANVVAGRLTGLALPARSGAVLVVGALDSCEQMCYNPHKSLSKVVQAMEQHYSIGQVSRILGVSRATLRRWEQCGKLPADVRTQGGHRRYSESSLRCFLGKPLPKEGTRKTILYARVSSRAQRPDLDHQVQALKRFCEAQGLAYDDVFVDIGSALNYRRPRFVRLLTAAMNGQVDKVVIAHKDRLVRFGYELVEQLLAAWGVEILIINRSEKPEFIQELAEDFIAIVQHFCARFYGKRSYKYKQAVTLAQQTAEVIKDP